MIYYVIVELHNDKLNSIQGPYMSDIEAFDHIDKLSAHRAKHPVPIRIDWIVNKVYPPDYVG